ncbi:sn-glycerol-3-phosphate import ATP-binding protein UgpC [uncultured Cohaesibacter sp.]|uniref:sn-glycerol-3-phosphate import ATP-binding protein UgpC n=1 Tax=uncultured Cohaesibacter sp. TaxID=1002546 RepID=UPI00292FD75B|nr:sn-glycerol-3-phosphate import ATP-binding protein UgpC [uncultured Cohaesibacter sp.]
MSKIKLENIRKSYGPNEVIHGINGTIEEGEFVVIVGPSGCGKSTLLRMIAGLEGISDGEIRIGDRVVNKLEPAQRNIAMVFQNYALYPHMSVYDNMSYGLKIRKVPRDEIRRRVEATAEILELTPYLKRSPRQLSGGQRQRVAMGRAIVREPSVFLFDEPLSNLDAKLRVQMRLEIKKLQERLGITSVYVTHDQVEAMTLGHRLMVLSAGNVEQYGTPIDLYDKPATLFVATFIGSPAMNILEGKLSDDGSLVLLHQGEKIPLESPLAEHGGKKVKLGMRPEHIRLAEESNTLFSVVTDVVEELGADTIIHANFGKEDESITVRLDGVHRVQSGTRFDLTIDKSNLHVFDPESGLRIN